MMLHQRNTVNKLITLGVPGCASRKLEPLGVFEPEAPLQEVRFGSCVTSIVMSTAMRNCTRDKGGPFGFGDQDLISTHRTLLRSRAI